MSDYILVHDGDRVALTTRDYLYLRSNDPFWRKYVNGEASPLDFEQALQMRLSFLKWVELDQINDKCVVDNLHVYRSIVDNYDAFNFYVMINGESRKILHPLAYCCRFQKGELVTFSFDQNEIIFTPERILSEWQYLYRKAVLNQTGFASDSWMYQVWLVVHELYEGGRLYDALEVLACAQARAKAESNLDAFNRFREIENAMR